MKYDLRMNQKIWFEFEQIKADPVLNFVAERLEVLEGWLEVTADSKEEAFELFFGFPYEAEDGSDAGYSELPDEVRELMNFDPFEYGYSTIRSGGIVYEILSEEVW